MKESRSWLDYRLGDVAPASSNGHPAATTTVWNLSLEDVESNTGRILSRTHCLVNELGSSKCSFDSRHVLYSKLRPYLNKVVLPDGPGVGTSELIPMLPDSNRIDREYLAYYLRSPIFLSFAKANTRGANLPRIAMSELWNHAVRTPHSLQEQHRIVGRINECLNRVEEIDMLRIGSQNESTVFIRAYYHDLYHELLNSNPAFLLKDAGEARGGGTPSKNRSDFWQGNIPWISPKEMKRRYIAESSSCITEQAIENSSTRLIEKPSVLFVVRGMILAHTFPVAVSQVPVTLNQDMKAITPNEGLDVDFLATMLKGAEREILSRIEVAGHGTRRLQTDNWNSIRIPQLTLDKQKTVMDAVKRTERLADELAESFSSKNVGLLRDSILRKAFAGEL